MKGITTASPIKRISEVLKEIHKRKPKIVPLSPKGFEIKLQIYQSSVILNIPYVFYTHSSLIKASKGKKWPLSSSNAITIQIVRNLILRPHQAYGMRNSQCEAQKPV